MAELQVVRMIEESRKRLQKSLDQIQEIETISTRVHVPPIRRHPLFSKDLSIRMAEKCQWSPWYEMVEEAEEV